MDLVVLLQEQVREIFSLLTQYFGVQFVESASHGITIAVGDLRAIDPYTPTGPGSAAGMADKCRGWRAAYRTAAASLPKAPCGSQAEPACARELRGATRHHRPRPR